MKFVKFLIVAVTVLGCSNPVEPVSRPPAPHPNPHSIVVQSARRKHQKNTVSALAVYQSVNGVVEIPDSLFTEPYLFVKNCTGSTIYDPASYFLATQGAYSTLIPSDPACTGAGSTYGFIPSNGNVVISKPGVDFQVSVIDDPSYALSYEAEPRTLLVIDEQ